MKILVTGMGIVSPIGSNVSGNLESLIHQRDGLSAIEILQDRRKEFIGGEIKRSDAELKSDLRIDHDRVVHRSTLLGLTAAVEAWGDRKETGENSTVLIYGTTSGEINFSRTGNSATDNTGKTVDYECMYDSSFGIDVIAEHIGISGERFAISTACSTGANAIMLGARLIRSGRYKRALVGTGESITNYNLNGFDSLLLYDNQKCSPFDEDRRGLNIGEAGCFLVLESEQSAKENNNPGIAELIGWANSCDAFHLTASSPDGTGAVLAMNEAMQMANLSPKQIDYINAHGTGTANNDLSEAKAMHQVFGREVPPFSATKSYVGHTLAAAGALEAVFTIFALQSGIPFSTLHNKTRMQDVPFGPITGIPPQKQIRIAMSNSFGFGGNCTELIFSK